jgi:hypothetical protein
LLPVLIERQSLQTRRSDKSAPSPTQEEEEEEGKEETGRTLRHQ